MRCIVLFAAGGAVALSWAAAANAESGWYVAGSAGGYFREGVTEGETFYKITDPSVTAPGTIKFSFDPGAVANISVGYRVASHFRIETELGYDSYVGSSLNPFTTNPNFPHFDGRTFTRQSGAEYSRFTGTVNIFYDFSPLASRFTPYVGVGVGGESGRKTAGHFVSADGTTITGQSGTGSAVLGLVEGGLNIALSKHWSVVPAYRYIHVFDGNGEAAHIAKLGIRYSF
jgi:opacity protein-like surface antigen